MTSEDIPRLIYLVLLLCMVGGYFLMSQRRNLGKVARYAVIWAFLFLGAIVAAGLWTEMRNDLFPRQSVIQGGAVEVPRAPDGHFYLNLEVNGVPTRFVVDTGASAIVLTMADAAAAGIDIDTLIFSGRAQTANGRVETAPTRITTLTLGDIADSNVRAVVNGGEMRESLLGMSYLSRFSRLEIANGRLLLER